MKLYQVYIITDEMCPRPVFVTNSKQYAQEWTGRFNRIVKENRPRLEKHDWENAETDPFWFKYIMFDEPEAFYEQIKYREK